MTESIFRAIFKAEPLDEGTFEETIPWAVIMGPRSINGYIALPGGHPWRGKEDFAIDAEVHGGITFNSGEVIGFDTHHSGDGTHPGSELYTPGINDEPVFPEGIMPHVWELDEARAETMNLARQASGSNGKLTSNKKKKSNN